MTIPRRRINRYNRAVRQRLLRVARGPEGAGNGSDVGGGIDAVGADAAATPGSGAAALGVGPAAEAPHTVQ
jgi:hypothetical protein